ncbi:MAG: methionyl-tRNA formyltransferase, partial [Campylobacterota bacterium]|nr:methionyl-tRNA formyltransferase [Campylobacterota bacterium]
MKKIIYMGTPHYAKAILDSIIEMKHYEVSLVITQPDRPVGRKKVLTPPPVKELALKHGIEVLQPQNLKAQETQEAIEALKPDFIIVAAFGQILPRSILDIAPCINLHASILPHYRGASPVQQSLLNNDSYSGVTAMLMDVGLDTGDILGFQYFKIPSDMRLHGLMNQLTDDAAKLTLDILARFDELKPLSQLDIEASLCKKIKRQDGEIGFE